MKAHPILLQKKYTRLVSMLAEKKNISYNEALELFYHSFVYKLMKEGVSDMHCRSDLYLLEELENEYMKKAEVI